MDGQQAARVLVVAELCAAMGIGVEAALEGDQLAVSLDFSAVVV